jgi:hypothetical protein
MDEPVQERTRRNDQAPAPELTTILQPQTHHLAAGGDHGTGAADHEVYPGMRG